MKNFLFILMPFFLNAQASFNGINEIFLGAKKTDIERLTGQPINMKFDLEAFYSVKQKILYKGIEYDLIFKNYQNGLFLQDPVVALVSSENKSIKSILGIGIGDSLNQLIDVYNKNNIGLFDAVDANGNLIKNEKVFVVYNLNEEKNIIFTLHKDRIIRFTSEDNLYFN